MDVVTKAVRSMRPAIEQIQRARYVKAFACLLATMLDKACVAALEGRTEGLEEHIPMFAVDEAIYLRQARIRATRGRDPAVDLELELRCWYSPTLGQVLGYVYCEFQDEVLKLLTDQGVAVGYAFWDNTDPDPSVPASEWAERKREWDAALDGHAGASFTFLFDASMVNYVPSWAELEAALPSLEFRAQDVAQTALFARWLVENPEPADSSETYGRFIDFRDELRANDQLQARLAAEVDRYKSILATGEAFNDAANRKQLIKVPRKEH